MSDLAKDWIRNSTQEELMGILAHLIIMRASIEDVLNDIGENLGIEEDQTEADLIQAFNKRLSDQDLDDSRLILTTLKTEEGASVKMEFHKRAPQS